MLGTRCVRHWSSTQTTLALSSAESEVHGIATGASIGLGLRFIGGDLGLNLKKMMLTDAPAALGIVRRSGLGRIRHLDITHLWLQETIRSGGFTVNKIDGNNNVADILTNSVDRSTLVRHLTSLNMFPEDGRAETAPKLVEQT